MQNQGIGRMLRPPQAPGAPRPQGPAPWMQQHTPGSQGAGMPPWMQGAGGQIGEKLPPWMQPGGPSMAGAPVSPPPLPPLPPAPAPVAPPGGMQSGMNMPGQGMPGSLGTAPQDEAQRLRRAIGLPGY